MSDTSRLIEQLTRPEAYRHDFDGDVEVVQTHISVLFFAGDRVFKVKKRVDMGFLDYRTLEQRRHFCEEEVRLNQALAPGVYLGVVPIREHDGALLAGGDEGDIVDYAVQMVRLPADGMMSRLLERGAVDTDLLDELADKLAAFHASCPTGPDVTRFATPASLREHVESNMKGLARFAAAPGQNAEAGLRTHSAQLHAFLRDAELTFIDEHETLLEQRIAGGRIREGHGDVRADNICVRDREIVIYDRIEFSRRFRCRDVTCDLAFFGVDLDVRGHRDLADYFVSRYGEAADDPGVMRLIAFYKLHMAIIHGKIASLRAIDDAVDSDDRDRSRRDALRHLHLAAGYALPPCLLLTCGLPATGKSVVAAALAESLNAEFVRTDVIRKTLAGATPTERLDESLYDAAFTERTYAEALRQATAAIESGRTAIVDATFQTAALRRPFVERADAASVPILVVEVTCPDDVIRERLAARSRDDSSVSDAGMKAYELIRSRFESPDEVGSRVVVDGRDDALDSTAEVINALVERM